MALYRRTREDCFNCGAQIPKDVAKEDSGAYRRYVCPKCYDAVLHGIVQTGGETQTSAVRPPTYIPDYVQEIGDVDFHRWEVWWIESNYVALMNGYCIGGTKQFLDYVDSIRSL